MAPVVRKQLNCRIDARLIRAARRYAHEKGVPLQVLIETVLADLQLQIERGQRPLSALLRKYRRASDNGAAH